MDRQESSGTKEKETLIGQYVKVLGVVTVYWFVSISMVFLNKYLLSDTLEAPLLVTWYQCVVSVALCALFAQLAAWFPNQISFPEFSIDYKLSREVLPLSLVFVGMITFNNLCLRNVGVAFYFLGRSLTTVFNVVCTYLILGEKTVRAALFWCAVIIAGFWLGVDQESLDGDLSWTGVIFGVVAALCVALNAIYTKKTLPFVGDNIWRLTLYNNLNACAIFLPFMLLNGDIQALLAYDQATNAGFWFYMSAAGFLGFGMGYVTGLQIQVTSPLTHNISGTAKAAAQTVIAVAVNGDIKTLFWWLSNLVVLFGSAGYTYTKQQLMKKGFASNKTTLSNVLVDKEPLIKTSDLENDEDSV